MRSQDSSQSWSNVMKANATSVALRDRVSNDGGTGYGMEAAGWNPYDVWLSRIKEPRDHAASSPASASLNPASNMPG